MVPARRSLRLTPADQERIKVLLARSGVDASSSEILVAALAHYRAQLPLAADVVEELNVQLTQEEGRANDTKVTSFSLQEHEAASLDELLRTATLTRRFSTNALVRLALLVFSFAAPEVVRAACLSLPSRPKPGPRRAAIR
jgi:hypothetical protein